MTRDELIGFLNKFAAEPTEFVKLYVDDGKKRVEVYITSFEKEIGIDEIILNLEHV